VLSLLALDETPVADGSFVPAGLAGTLAAVQALGDAGIAAPLWVATLGAMSTGPGEPVSHPVQAQAWGLGRVVGLEHPDRWGGLIDLPASWDQRTASRLAAVLADGTEDQVALRGPGTLARRLVRAETRRAVPRPRPEHTTNGHSNGHGGTNGSGPAGWRPRGTALLTGGTGSVGARVGSWLAGQGAPRVLLTSRSGPAAPDVAALASDIAGRGSAVEIVSCDTARRDQVAALLDHIADTGPALSTVLHSANAVYLSPLEYTDVAGLHTALGAKAAGARWLDELTADLDLDAFVLFSSIAATWGSNAHGAYAAGNAYLDALAEDRRRRGLRATSIAWGVWDTRDWAALDAATEETPGSVTPARLLRQGMNFLDADRALTGLEQVITDDETFLALADVDWARFAPVFTAVRPRPLLDRIPEAAVPAAGADADAGEAGQADQLAGTLADESDAERARVLTELVRTHAAAVLGHSSPGAVPAGRPFRDLGFDSLTAVELRNRLSAATGLRLPSTSVFDYPRPAALAEHIRSRMFTDGGGDHLPLLESLEKLGATLADAPDDAARQDAAARLEALAQRLRGTPAGEPDDHRDIDAASADEMFDLLEGELNDPDFD
jgi:NADP-dependent 3-hydroxy acid dehydrogenase YdfG/acyl carrier protein